MSSLYRASVLGLLFVIALSSIPPGKSLAILGVFIFFVMGMVGLRSDK